MFSFFTLVAVFRPLAQLRTTVRSCLYLHLCSSICTLFSRLSRLHIHPFFLVSHLSESTMEYLEAFMDLLSEGDKELDRLRDAKQQLMIEQNRAYLDAVFGDNQSVPISVRNVQVTNAQSFRAGFLRHQLQPLLAPGVMTLADFVRRMDQAYALLAKCEVLESGHVAVHRVAPTAWARAPHTAAVVPVFNIVPQKRFYAKTGTNIGNGEGDGYVQLQWKNVFGGGENVVLDAVSGTKTPSLYLASLAMPLACDPRVWWDTSVYTNTRKLEWLQSSVATAGVTTRVATRCDSPINGEATADFAWRRMANHGSRALEVLAHLKDTFKASVGASVRYDTRDSAVLPTAGQYARAAVEHCGAATGSTVAYTKVALEAQAARAVSDRHTVVTTHKAGLLVGAASVLDRFFAGGPNDVRLFLLHGLGPKDNNLAVGGDCYVSGGVSVISRLPRAPHDTGFRWHSFLNYGKLVGAGPAPWRQLGGGVSTSAGMGLLYNHPMARFELNFVLPLSAHASDYTRKGIQYGVGVSFL